MAFLKVVKGPGAGQVYELQSGRVVLGRHPNCEIVVDHEAVSRHHAQILENHGSFFLEDLRSLNRTYLNGTAIDRRTELSDLDIINVCEVVFRFHTQLSRSERSQTPPQELGSRSHRGGSDTAEIATGGFQPTQIDDDVDAAFPESSSAVVTMLNTHAGTSLRAGVNAEAKLRAVIDIGRTLTNTLDVHEILRKSLDGLFKLFHQADSGFVLLEDPVSRKLVVQAKKYRDERSGPAPRISMTVVRQVMENGDAILSTDVVGDQRFAGSESLDSMPVKSIMCVPLLSTDGTAMGVMQIDSESLDHPFTEDDLDMLSSVVSQASMAVENANLHDRLLQQREMQRELELATQIQLDFLPNERPNLPGYRFYDYYEAALRVGGDYFDYVALSDGRLAIAVGDVAGKGVPAALLMASLYSTARFHLLTQPTLAQTLGGLNAQIASGGLGHRFISLVLILLDPRSHLVTVANAGHLPPLLRQSNRKLTAIGLSESGMPLGVIPNQTFREAKISLQPGDTLALYTDGITEAMNPASEIYGRSRLGEFVSRGPSKVDELVAGIVADVEKFCAGRAQRDDLCLVCLQRVE